MSEKVSLVPGITPWAMTATSDLRNDQNKFVQVYPVGVVLADARSFAGAGVPATGIYVLDNKANSGQQCALNLAPNVARVVAGEAIGAGRWVQPMSATGLAGVSSQGHPGAQGIALVAATGSGHLISVHLRR